MLWKIERRRLAGRPDRDETIDAVLDLIFDLLAQARFIDLPLTEGRDHRRHGAANVQHGGILVTSGLGVSPERSGGTPKPLLIATRFQVFTNRFEQPKFQSIPDQRMPDGHFRHARDLLQKRRKVLQIQIMPGINFKPHFDGEFRVASS